MDSVSYNPASEIVTFDQGWCRRSERHEATLYRNTYTNAYKDRLTEFLRRGKESIRKDEHSDEEGIN